MVFTKTFKFRLRSAKAAIAGGRGDKVYWTTGVITTITSQFSQTAIRPGRCSGSHKSACSHKATFSPNCLSSIVGIKPLKVSGRDSRPDGLLIPNFMLFTDLISVRNGQATTISQHGFIP